MCNSRFHSLPSAQRGISLILVIFLLVVVAMLVVAMARLNSGNQKIVSQEILSVRALFAAESGAQSMAMNIFPIGSPARTTCPVIPLITFPAAATGLNGCTANLTCTTTTSGPRTVFTVKSEGRCDGGTEQARRMITVGLRAP
jgi:MSHA biogenesis protein MshP